MIIAKENNCKLVENGKIKGSEIDFLLIRPTIIKEDQKGNIFIYDSQEKSITKLNNEMNFVKKFGRKGKGPGEFLRINLLELDEKGCVYIYDSGNMRLTVFDNDGNYLRSSNEKKYIKKIEFVKHKIVFETLESGAITKDGIATSKLYVSDKDLGNRILIDSVSYKTDTQISKPVETNLPLPYAGVFIWTSDRKSKIFTCISNENKIETIDLLGKNIHTQELELEKARVKQSDKEKFLSSLGFYDGNNFSNSIPKQLGRMIKFPEYKEYILGLSYFNHVLILQSNSSKQNQLFWVATSKDQTLCSFSLDLTSPDYLLSYSNNGLFLIEYDKEGLPQITKYLFSINK